MVHPYFRNLALCVSLPKSGEEKNMQSESRTQSVGEHAGGAILVMDDEEMIRSMTAEMLEYLGYGVTTCKHGQEALDRYQEAAGFGTPFLMVIVDLTIPGGMGGKETARNILAIDPNACLIVSSGYSSDPILSDYRSYGFSGAVSKPYKITEFGRLISSILSARSATA